MDDPQSDYDAENHHRDARCHSGDETEGDPGKNRVTYRAREEDHAKTRRRNAHGSTHRGYE